jgi:hypothetical protein
MQNNLKLAASGRGNSRRPACETELQRRDLLKRQVTANNGGEALAPN